MRARAASRMRRRVRCPRSTFRDSLRAARFPTTTAPIATSGSFA
jgi:hypothetical protein